MNVQEITKQLYAIGRAFGEKISEQQGVEPEMTIADDCCEIRLWKDWKVFARAKGETPEAAIAEAFRIINDLPTLEAASLTRYMGEVAKVVDLGRELSIADEYVAPLQMTVKAMTDNLLTVQVPE